MRILRNPDLVSGLALLAIGGVAIWLSLGIRPGFELTAIPPNFVPLICAWGMVGCGVLMVLKSFREVQAPQPVLLDARIVGVGLLIGLYYWFFEYVDFRIGSWGFVLASMLVLGCRDLRQLLIVPAAVSISIYLIFRYLFTILLPTWF